MSMSPPSAWILRGPDSAGGGPTCASNIALTHRSQEQDSLTIHSLDHLSPSEDSKLRISPCRTPSQPGSPKSPTLLPWKKGNQRRHRLLPPSVLSDVGSPSPPSPGGKG